MITTAMLFEMVLIGVSSFTWLFPLLNSLFYIRFTIQNLNFETGILLICFSYLCGMIINQVAHYLINPLDCIILNNCSYNKSELQKVRSQIYIKSESGSAYIGQRRSAVRIFRCTSINVLCFLLTYLSGNSELLLITSGIKDVTLIFGLMLCFVFCLLSYSRSLIGYYRFLSDASLENSND